MTQKQTDHFFFPVVFPALLLGNYGANVCRWLSINATAKQRGWYIQQ